ncbi:MAG: hypothetical protein JWP27_279 [Flaviaesturariibacter sp.]|nr:hypothetical protein [Flaviaesturariibacter sp.]
MFLKSILIGSSVALLSLSCTGQKMKSKTKIKSAQSTSAAKPVSNIVPGADQLDKYLPLLKGKRVALLVNHTSTIGGAHTVDALLKQGVDIKVIFGPEHGFRGDAPDGAKIETTADAKTGIPVVSLYGKKNKPAPEDLKDVDIMLYDIQDVGTRFYTFISSMQYYMEAALENNIPLVILDRPNPNGFYVDGPVLDPKFKSFVGLQPVPIVYGMTIGEYANMLLQEDWLGKEATEAHHRLATQRYREGARFFQLTVIPCAGYTHQSKYVLPKAPSPNLPEIQSVYWYATTCLFEGTALSEGRGTPTPFQVFGHPTLPQTLYKFVPTGTPGAPNPKHKDQACYGWNLHGTPGEVLAAIDNRIQLKYILDAYRLFPDKANFFKEAGFNRLAGTDELMQQIRDGKTEAEIRQSWEPRLSAFKAIRKKYLLYPDFN